MTAVVISSGHGLYIRGAADIIDEVDEARRVVDQVAKYMQALGVDVTTFHDNVSTTQDENLNRIVDFHNAQVRDVDVSVHFNASKHTSEPVGTEVFYETQYTLAADMSATIADVGFKDRGPKQPESGLFFLSNTAMPAILIEVCFVDSESDVEVYQDNFDEVCRAIAEVLAGEDLEMMERSEREPHERPDRSGIEAAFSGKVSWFGGPDDTGVSPSEGLAFIYDIDMAPGLFLDEQPPGTTGLARRLNPAQFYIACRWDYDVTPKEMLANQNLQALVRAKKNGRTTIARPADWGPHSDTDRAADISPGMMEALDLTTDDEIEVVYPAPRPLIG